MPGTSTPRCSFGVKWPLEGAHGGHRQEREAHEHVRAVESGEAVEDRALRVVVKGEAQVHVLVDLDREEREPEPDGGEEADPQRAWVAPARPLERPVHRDAGGQQDAGVHARDRDRQVLAVEREPAAVVHDPDEEVGREERSEEHDLRDDEKQHPEELGLHARGARWPRAARGARARGRRDRRLSRRTPSALAHHVLDRLAGGGPARGRSGRRAASPSGSRGRSR